MTDLGTQAAMNKTGQSKTNFEYGGELERQDSLPISISRTKGAGFKSAK